jgi:flagellar protein FlgJ
MPESISAPVLQMQAMDVTKRIGGVKENAASGQPPALEKDSRELKNACAELESLFIFHLLKEMRAAIPKSGLLSGGRGEEMYTSMFDAQVARELASKRGLGLSSMLMERLEPKSVPKQINVHKE